MTKRVKTKRKRRINKCRIVGTTLLEAGDVGGVGEELRARGFDYATTYVDNSPGRFADTQTVAIWRDADLTGTEDEAVTKFWGDIRGIVSGLDNLVVVPSDFVPTYGNPYPEKLMALQERGVSPNDNPGRPL
jgi:hypothetical protein